MSYPTSYKELAQAGILGAIPQHACYATLNARQAVSGDAIQKALCALTVSKRAVLGVGPQLASRLALKVPGLHGFDAAAMSSPAVTLPATPADLWLWVHGADPGQAFHALRALLATLSAAFDVANVTQAFEYAKGKDLSGYEDGTENPINQAALDAALLQEGQWAGSSFVAVQHWQHRFGDLDAMSKHTLDHTIGRERVGNEELDDAPSSAHVKRTAQESFEPEAFVVRRSMPWVRGLDAGLVFTAFGRNFDAFEALLRNMTGANDGIVDGLFSFSQPVSSAYFWCPPVANERLVLTPL